MTRKAFEKLRMSIEEQNFFGNYTSPIEYGIQRAAFAKKKFEKLIAAAHKVNFKTTRAKVKQWQRQLEKAEETYDRFMVLRKDIDAAKIQIQIGGIPSANGKHKIRL